MDNAPQNDGELFLDHRFVPVGVRDKAILRQAKWSYLPLDIYPVFDLTFNEQHEARNA